MTGPEPSHPKRRCQTYRDVASSGQKVDNSGSTLQKLFQLYRQADLCDVQLQVGVHLFHAHKLILSMSSDVFKTMLTDAKWPDARKARIVLNEEPECVKVFGEFLQYMYTGNIHLNNSSVLPVLTLADKYNIHDLGNVCRKYMLSHCHASFENLKVISWLQYAILCNEHDLETTLRCYMELNFNHVMQSEDFLTMRADILEEVLQYEHLVIHSEYALFVSLKRWLMHNTGASMDNKQSKAKLVSEKKTILRIMSHIRFPLMKESQILILQSDAFVHQHADFFTPKLRAAWMVHAHKGSKSLVCIGGATGSSRHSHQGSSHLSGQSVESGSESYTACESRKTLSGHCSKGSKLLTSHSSAGSRTVLRCNSNSGIVHSSPASKEDFLRKLHLVHCSVKSLSERSGSASESAESRANESYDDNVDVTCSCLGDMTTGSPMSNVIPGSSSGGSANYTPRNYTCDDWSTCLAIEDFVEFPRYSSHTYFFSTPASALPSSVSTCHRPEEWDDCGTLEWQAELYPKGVRFPPAKMIGIPFNYDIDENCQEVVRLAISSKTHHHHPCRVDISVLAVAMGMEDGSEYMEALAHKSCIFDADHSLHNIDDIVSFAELNRLSSKYLTESVVAPGIGKSCFKVVVIIKPSH